MTILFCFTLAHIQIHPCDKMQVAMLRKQHVLKVGILLNYPKLSYILV